MTPGCRVPSFGGLHGTVIRTMWSQSDNRPLMLILDDNGHTQWGWVPEPEEAPAS